MSGLRDLAIDHEFAPGHEPGPFEAMMIGLQSGSGASEWLVIMAVFAALCMVFALVIDICLTTPRQRSVRFRPHRPLDPPYY